MDLHPRNWSLHTPGKARFNTRKELTKTHLADLKSTSDDALLPYLSTLPAPYTFAADNSKTNIRFLLGYSAVAIAGFTFYADRYLGWEAVTSPWIIAAVVTYFILNSLLTFWLWAVEAGEVFSGKRKTGETVRFLFFFLSVITLALWSAFS